MRTQERVIMAWGLAHSKCSVNMISWVLKNAQNSLHSSSSKKKLFVKLPRKESTRKSQLLQKKRSLVLNQPDFSNLYLYNLVQEAFCS